MLCQELSTIKVGLIGENGNAMPEKGDFWHEKLYECFQKAGVEIASCDDADIIIMPIQGRERFGFERHVVRSEFYKRYRKKIVAYSGLDLKYPRMPGIYTSATPFWSSVGWVKGGHYLASYIHSHAFDPARRARDLLFSFVGSARTSPVRKKILQLNCPRACIIDSDEGDAKRYWWQTSVERAEHCRAKFKDVMERTKFAICPRGVDAASIRLFEAMQAGCVPVIVSDRLVLPEGPDWPSFSIRVRECDIVRIPVIVAEHEPQFEEMSRRAREAWERWFADGVTVRSLAVWGLSIRENLTPARRLTLTFLSWLGTWVLASNTRWGERLHMAAVTNAPRGVKDRVKRVIGK